MLPAMAVPAPSVEVLALGGVELKCSPRHPRGQDYRVEVPALGGVELKSKSEPCGVLGQFS